MSWLVTTFRSLTRVEVTSYGRTVMVTDNVQKLFRGKVISSGRSSVVADNVENLRRGDVISLW